MKPLTRAALIGAIALLDVGLGMQAYTNQVSVQAPKLQVIQRARRLKADNTTAIAALGASGAWLDAARRRVDDASASGQTLVFNGRAASDLNALAAAHPGAVAIKVAGPDLVLDEPVRLHAGERLDLGETSLNGAPAGSAYDVRIEDADHATLTGGRFSGPGAGVLVQGSRDVAVVGGSFVEMGKPAIVVAESAEVTVWRNRIERRARAGVLVLGDSRRVTVAMNEIVGSTGAANWDAGIVLTDVPGDEAADPLAFYDPANLYWVQAPPIRGNLATPRDNLVIGNHVSDGRSGGIYVDGAVATVVAANVVENNAKEGLCLDNGATADVVAFNTIRSNGKRGGMSDRELTLEFVKRWGRLADGSSAAKLPGLSIDNAAYNLVYANRLEGNFGGGVKMVRTAFYNLIIANGLRGDSASPLSTKPFPEILFGSAKLDIPSDVLDGAPSRGNVTAANIGKRHARLWMLVMSDSDGNKILDR